jgi:HK97 family phage prohead protease
MTSLGHHIYTKHFAALKLTRTPTDGSGFFEGLASTWDVDRDGERFAFGAWADSIIEWQKVGSMPPLFYSHRSSEPQDIIGRVLSMRETVDGLLISGQLDLSSPVAVSAYERMLAGTLDTMSVGFVYDRTHLEDGVRIIDQAELLEISLTPIPSNPLARVSTVKNADNPGRPDPNSPQLWRNRIDQAAKRTVVPDAAARKAVEALMLEVKLERVNEALARAKQAAWEEQMRINLVRVPVPIRVDARMRPVIPEQPSP